MTLFSLCLPASQPNTQSLLIPTALRCCQVTHYVGALNEQGQPNGQGANFLSDGSPAITPLVDAADASKSGRWMNGKVQGRATQRYPSGDRYDGMFKDGDFEGLGVFNWKDGSRYESEWAAGERNGFFAQWNSHGEPDGCGRWAEHALHLCAVPLSVFRRSASSALMVSQPHMLACSLPRSFSSVCV